MLVRWRQGGVWSSTRRYPGLGTQNVKQTYHLSDMRMPEEFPEWPNAEQVQSYLYDYVKKHRLADAIHLNTQVESIRRPHNGNGRGWTVTTSSTDESASVKSRRTAAFDHVVVANGVFCQGAIPKIEQTEGWIQAGGQVLHTSDYRGLAQPAKGRHVVVVGYGRSACDLANQMAEIAESTTVVARRLTWKLPRHIGGWLNYKYLLLTRLGESLFQYIRPGPVERFLYSRWGNMLRSSILSCVGGLTRRQLMLSDLDAVPRGPFTDIASARIALSTEGFFDKVHQRQRLFLKRDAIITRLYVDASSGNRVAQLSTGEAIRADIVFCGTGFRQQCPFLPQDVIDSITDSEGNWAGLYRMILPVGVPDLTFNGYNSSLFCPTSSEMAALWIAAYLESQQTHTKELDQRHPQLLSLPSEEVQREDAQQFFDWLNEHSKGKHAHGTNCVPFSLHQVQDLLGDMGVQLPWLASAKQWVLPMDPAAYGHCIAQVKQRVKRG